MILKSFSLIALLLLLFDSSLAQSQDDRLTKLLSKRAIIEDITFKGNTTFSEKILLEKMYSKEDGFWQSLRLMRSNRYTKLSYANDQVQLQFFYRSEGFHDVEVKIMLTPGSDPNKVVVLVTINEGDRYRIRSVNVTGVLGAEAPQIYSAISLLRVGSFLNDVAINVVQNSVKTVFANRGYPYANIRMIVNKDTTENVADIEVTVDRQELVVFGDVYVDTNLHTRPHVFYREVTFKRGEVYTRDKYFETQQRLIRTGLFNFVSLNTPDSMSTLDSLQPNFYISAVERRPRYVGFGVGAGQDKEAGVAFSLLGKFGDRNISGTARAVNFGVSANFTRKDSLIVRPTYQFSYTEPYPFKTRMPLILTLKYEPRATSTLGNYQIRTFTVDATAVREFSLVTKLSTSLNYEEVELRSDIDRDSIPEARRDEEGLSVYRRGVLLLERDSRPIQTRFNPPDGSYTSYRFEYVGGILGGDASFVKLVYNWSKYNRLGPHTIFASRLRLGYVEDFGPTDHVPVKERFYLGGAYTLRGFPENDFSPKATVTSDSGEVTQEAVGGEAMILLNLEIRKPLFGNIWWSYFIDSGLNSPAIGLISLKQIALTAGLGIQYMSPVGPIRLDYGRRIGINNYDVGGHWHIGILYAF